MKPKLNDFIAFLRDRGVKDECPRCGRKDWNLNTKPSPWAGLWGATEKDEFSLDAPIYDGFFLMCTNCGFVALHAKHYFDAWFSARGGKN